MNKSFDYFHDLATKADSFIVRRVLITFKKYF